VEKSLILQTFPVSQAVSLGAESTGRTLQNNNRGPVEVIGVRLLEVKCWEDRAASIRCITTEEIHWITMTGKN
jgi:hypothetical protein